MRAHEYSPDLWTKLTGKPVDQLAAEWKASCPTHPTTP